MAKEIQHLFHIQPFTQRSRLLTPLQQTTFENIEAKEEIAHNQVLNSFKY